MNNIFLPGIFCLLISVPSFAQEITMYKTFGGVRFERDSAVLSVRQVLEILKEKPRAYDEFKKAKANATVAGVLGFTGGILIGIPLGTALVGGDPEWRLIAAGAVFVLGSIPFNRLFKARALNALDLYNGKEITSRLRPQLYLTGTTARLVITF